MCSEVVKLSTRQNGEGFNDRERILLLRPNPAEPEPESSGIHSWMLASAVSTRHSAISPRMLTA